jgi:hypothetical protein
MALFDRAPGLGPQRPAARESNDDDQAIARYRYMLRTAPPDTIEQAHAEAFAKLTPEQRRKVLDELAGAAPGGEREALLRAGDAPGALAQAATRAEIREPGAIERIFGRGTSQQGAAAPGLGSFLGSAFVGSLAGTVLGSMVAQHFLVAHPPSTQALADLSGPHGGHLDPSTDDARHDPAAYESGGDGDDLGFGDGDFDLPDTFDV